MIPCRTLPSLPMRDIARLFGISHQRCHRPSGTRQRRRASQALTQRQQGVVACAGTNVLMMRAHPKNERIKKQMYRSLGRVKAKIRSMSRQAVKLRVVRALNGLCTWVDDLAYRPVVVKLTRWLPRWWSCQLAHLSMKLDKRWDTGYWKSANAPPVPDGLCEACGRRAAWLVIGGADPNEKLDQDVTYLDQNPIHICAWCMIDSALPISNRGERDFALADAGERSIAFRWHWHPFP